MFLIRQIAHVAGTHDITDELIDYFHTTWMNPLHFVSICNGAVFRFYCTLIGLIYLQNFSIFNRVNPQSNLSHSINVRRDTQSDSMNIVQR